MAPISRLIVLPSRPVIIHGNTDILVPPSWPAKDPEDTVLCTVDFSQVIGSAAITGLLVRSEGITVNQSGIFGSTVSVGLSGGTVGISGTLALIINTSANETIRQVITIPVITAAPELGEVQMAVQFSGIVTPDATPIVLGTFGSMILNSTALQLQGTVMARNIATGAPIVWNVSATVQGLGSGAPAFVGDPLATINAQDPTMVGCNLVPTVGPLGIILTGTGLAGTPITWSGTFTPTAA
jgi:hypothetical protein